MVKLLSDIINGDPALCVIGTASNGYEALQKTKTLRPDVITMDVNMPRMDGLKAVEHIMSVIPTPIVMISSLTQKGATMTVQALNLGAIDFVPKPSGYVSLDIEELTTEIVAKIKLASKIRVVRTVKHTVPRSARQSEAKKLLTKRPETAFEVALRYTLSQISPASLRYEKVVAIGCSTGGPQALNEILRRFPIDFPAPILIVQHMPEKFTEKLAALLNSRIELAVVEAKEGMKLQRGIVYIAPGAYHMTIRPERTVSLISKAASVPLPCPSVDMLMQSVAEVFGKNAIGVLLTGMGDDGVLGMNAIKDAYGATIAQDEETSLVFGMPRMAIESGCIDSIAPLERIADEVIELIGISNAFSQFQKK
jgi:two-component system chemotaxis response regulator CheB